MPQHTSQFTCLAYTVTCMHPLQVVVLLRTLLYSTVQSTVVQYMDVHMPRMSRSKHKSRGDVAGTTILFKVLDTAHSYIGVCSSKVRHSPIPHRALASISRLAVGCTAVLMASLAFPSTSPSVTEQDTMGPSWDRPSPNIICFSSSLKYLKNSIWCTFQSELFYRCENPGLPLVAQLVKNSLAMRETWV